MRIAQIAPPLETVPPTGYGGTERVISTLTDELVRRGHHVTVFAAGDSRSSGRLVATVDRALWHRSPAYGDFSPFWAVTLGHVLDHLDEFDLVHSHLDFHAFPLARSAEVPFLTTLHGRLDLPELAPLYRHFDDVPLVSISNAQRAPLPSANWIATVHHGIDQEQLPFQPRRGAYLAFLGRISPEKGLDAAIRVARQAGMPLKIGGRMPLPFTDDPGARRDREYFEQRVKPLLREPGVELIGEVGGADKAELLRGAAALLFPIGWPEPFGLVMAEALTCGTPVIAMRRGSVPEVLADGVTGFVCEDESDMVAAVARLADIDRATCRAEAVRRFSARAMGEAYERVYKWMLEGRSPIRLPVAAAT